MNDFKRKFGTISQSKEEYIEPSFMHSIGYRDTRSNGDVKAPDLKKKLKAFKNDISKRSVAYSFGFRSFFSAWTPYGLSQIKQGLAHRIFNNNRPMTLLKFDYSRSDTNSELPSPKFQADKKSPPVQGQWGGWYECPETGELKELPSNFIWKFHGYNEDENGKRKNLEDGEECSKATKFVYYSKKDKLNNNLNGRYIYPKRYKPEHSEINAYPGDVESAILASPLTDDDKQELLDCLYIQDDPVREVDSYFCKKVREYREDKNSHDCNLLALEIESNEVISREIKDNLLVNMGLMKDEDASYHKSRKQVN